MGAAFLTGQMEFRQALAGGRKLPWCREQPPSGLRAEQLIHHPLEPIHQRAVGRELMAPDQT